MKGNALTGIAIRGTTLEWTALRPGEKPGGTCSSRSVTLDLGEHPDIASAAMAAHDILVAQLREKCEVAPGPVSLGIPAAWVLVRVLNMPAAAPAELRGMVELQMDKFSPFPIENMQVSYEILNEHEGQITVLGSAIANDKVEALGAAFKDAGLPLARVDLNVFGLWNTLRDMPGVVPDHGARLLILRDGSACDILLIHERVPIIIRALGALETLTPEEQDEEISREITATLVGLEIDLGSDTIPITICHTGAEPAALIQRLADDQGVPVQALGLDDLTSMSWGIVTRAAAPVGSVLNLAPPSWKSEELARRARRQLIAAGIVALAFWIAGILTLFGFIYWEKQQARNLQAKIVKLTAPVEEVRAIQKRALTLEQYLDRSHSALECLLEVSRALPEGIELKSFLYRKGKAIEIGGLAGSVNMVYDFKKAMDESKLFIGADLPGTSRMPDGRENFKLTLKLPGGALE